MKIVMIGSMRHPELFERARLGLTLPDDDVMGWAIPENGDPTNAEIGHWHHHIDTADKVIVVPACDGSLGRGTVAELRHAMGTGKPIEWGG